MPVRVCGKPGEVRAPLVVSRLLSLLPRGLRARLTPSPLTGGRPWSFLKTGRKARLSSAGNCFSSARGSIPERWTAYSAPGRKRPPSNSSESTASTPDGVVGNQTYGQAMLLGFELGLRFHRRCKDQAPTGRETGLPSTAQQFPPGRSLLESIPINTTRAPTTPPR